MRHVLLIGAAMAVFSTAAFARQPSGEGDPAQSRCMYVESATGKLGSGSLCKTNAEWAQMKAEGIVLDQFGEPVPPPDARDVADHGCQPAYAGGPGRDGTSPMSFKCH